MGQVLRLAQAARPDELWGIVTVAYGISGSANYVFNTIDNGQNWSQAQVAAGRATGAARGGTGLLDLDVLDSQTAWALADDYNTNATKLLRTTSGPTGFSVLVSALPAPFYCLHFFSASTGVALARAAPGATQYPLYRTTDGGLSWNLVANAPQLTTGLNTNPFHTKDYQGNSLWISTSYNAVLHTADAGLNWSNQDFQDYNAFEDELRGLAFSRVGSGQQLFQTADGGASWMPITSSGQPLLSAIAAVPGRPGTYIGAYSAGGSVITRDRGLSWQNLSTDTFQFLQVVATSPTQLWAAMNFDYGGPTGPPANQTLLRLYAGTALPSRSSAAGAGPAFVYPNPTSGVVSVAASGSSQVCVYDGLGRLCVGPSPGGTLDLSAQPAGIYLLRVQGADNVISTHRVVLVK